MPNGEVAEVTGPDSAERPPLIHIHPYPPRTHYVCSCNRVFRTREAAEGHKRIFGADTSPCEGELREKDANAVLLNGLNYPSAFAIQTTVGHALEHDPKCSYVQADGALLCDCDAVVREWERLRHEFGPSAN